MFDEAWTDSEAAAQIVSERLDVEPGGDARGEAVEDPSGSPTGGDEISADECLGLEGPSWWDDGHQLGSPPVVNASVRNVDGVRQAGSEFDARQSGGRYRNDGVVGLDDVTVVDMRRYSAVVLLDGVNCCL
ncbi:hypothetical protein MINTM007_09280 [Mycobacterium intracellulare]|nr:hypothetical protein MINTM007_09280 [Mycobacterium intracellulare]